MGGGGTNTQNLPFFKLAAFGRPKTKYRGPYDFSRFGGGDYPEFPFPLATPLLVSIKKSHLKIMDQKIYSIKVSVTLRGDIQYIGHFDPIFTQRILKIGRIFKMCVYNICGS